MPPSSSHYSKNPLQPSSGICSEHSRSTALAFVTALAVLTSIFILSGCTTHNRKLVGSWPSAQVALPADQLTLLREAADYEALYTLAGGLKPMSSGFWRCSFEADGPDPIELQTVREMLGVLQNAVWHADVQIFEKVHDGERNAHAFVVHRKSLARMIDRHASFWSSWDITTDTHPTAIVDIVDRMPREDRWRGYGYLYGYPDAAVNFFVEAGVAADDGREMGPGKDRQFMQIPTYAADSGHFTYAVPLDHVSTSADLALIKVASLILEAYEQRRPHIDSTKDMVAELLELNEQFEHLAIIEQTEACDQEYPPTSSRSKPERIHFQ